MTSPRLWIRYALLGAALTLAAPAFAQTTTPAATPSVAPPSTPSVAAPKPPAAATQAVASQSEPQGLWLVTPHPVFTASAAKPASISLTLQNDTKLPQRATLAVTGLPKDWSAQFLGGGETIGAAMVLPAKSQFVTLKVTPAADAKLDTYQFTVAANYDGRIATVPISMTLSRKAEGGIKLQPELPALRGSAKSTFKYQIKVTNNGTADGLFNLTADTPPGFETSFTKGYGSDEITGIPVKAGATETVTLKVKLNASVAAGQYPISVNVLNGDQSAKTDLSLEVTGAPKLSLAGPHQRLSGEAVAGEAATFPFTLHNTGSAPASQIKMSAQAPNGWTVTFEPATINVLPPNGTQDVNVHIKPAGKAIAGDYMVNLRASTEADNTSEQFRVTVNTSTIWGLVGLAVIAAAVIVLALAVFRYGRR